MSEGDRISQPAGRLSEPATMQSDGTSILRPVPSVPRPSVRKPTFSGNETAPVATANAIPPPAKLPQGPGIDAVVARDAQPPPVPEIDAPTAPVAPPPVATGATEGAAKRRSRRTLKIPDDAVPAKASTGDRDSSLDATARASDEHPPAAFEVPPTSAPHLDASDFIETSDFSDTPAAPPPPPFLPASISSPAPAFTQASPPPPPVLASPPPAPPTVEADAEVIRPMRIISISSPDITVEVSQRTSNLPSDSAISTRTGEGERSSKPAPPPPASQTEIEAVEVDSLDAVEDDEPVTQPSEMLVTPTRSDDVDAVEEIEPDRISDVPEKAAVAPQPKKPPPPPPKRAPGDAGPPSRPAPAVADALNFSGMTATPPPVVVEPSKAAPEKPAAPPAPSVDPNKKRQKPWWEELFGDDFTRTMDHLDAKVIRKECDFIEDRLGLERGAVMLDLACGGGSHAVELASRGYSVVGYDLSLAMLAHAADEAQERGQKLNFLQGDMREMAFEETFDGVYCWSMSFGYFDDEKNLNVLSRIRRALRKGGMLLLDLTNRDYVAPRQPSLVWFEGDGCVCMDEMFVDFFTSRLRVKRTVMFEDGRSKEVDYSIRLYALHELGKMLHETGFKVVEVTGHPAHPGVFFGSESPRVIVLAERAD